MIKIHFGGSRKLAPSYFSEVAGVVSSSIQHGCAVHVGCAAGADAAVIKAALCDPLRLFLFAQFSSSGSGSFSGSAVQPVLFAQASGASVQFLAGGPLSFPLKARLIRRSLAALSGCSAAVFFLSHPRSSGSLNVAAAAVKNNIPVYAFPFGFVGMPAPLRSLPGGWQPSLFFDFPCFRWFSGQSLF